MFTRRIFRRSNGTRAGGITRKKAEGWHYLEILTEVSNPDCFVYLVIGKLCKHFQTVDEAMTFIEGFWEKENREHRLLAEYEEIPLQRDLFVYPTDEWEFIH